jgi:hypothetical protein
MDMDGIIKSLSERIAGLERRVEKIEIGTSSTSSQPPFSGAQSKQVSLREFLISKKPTDDVKTTLAVAYFLEKFEHLGSVNKKDLEAAIRRAKESLPANLNDKVNLAIKRGFLQEAAEKKDDLKAWYLTNSGEAFVESGFKKIL